MRVIFREQFFPVSMATPNLNMEQYRFILAKFAEHNLTPVQIELTEIEGNSFKSDLERINVELGREYMIDGYDHVAGIRIIYERPCHTATAQMLREQALHLQNISVWEGCINSRTSQYKAK